LSASAAVASGSTRESGAGLSVDARRHVGRRGDETFRAAAFVVLTREFLKIETEIGIADEAIAMLEIHDERRHSSGVH